jgi:hypothetical protein
MLMDAKRIVTKTTDGRFVGRVVVIADDKTTALIDDQQFPVNQLLPNKIVSSNYIIEFKIV